jgi:hypothetical protein
LSRIGDVTKTETDIGERARRAVLAAEETQTSARAGADNPVDFNLFAESDKLAETMGGNCRTSRSIDIFPPDLVERSSPASH